MPHAFVQLTAKLDHACAHGVVLTTTERLRRNLTLAYSETRVAEERLAWATPEIWTLDGYLTHLHDRARMQVPDLPDLLSAEAEFELFRATAPTGLERLIPLAREAWALCRHWEIDLTGANLAITDQGRTFLDWAKRLERRLESEHAITRADLPSLVHLSARSRRLCCLAFERTPRAYEAWLERQRAAGITVDHVHGPDVANQTAERMSFATRQQELAAITRWARDTLLEAPGARIGVVVPDLARRYHAIVRQFRAELDPLLESGTDGLIDVGGGTPLAEQPVWRAASDWLTLAFDRLPLAEARRVLNDPYLYLPQLPRLPDRAPPVIDLPALARHLGTPRLQALAQQAPAPGLRPLGRWLKDFLGTLDAAGWSGRHTGSVQFQAYTQARRRIEALATSPDPRPMSAAAALAVLGQYLSSTIFAPERAPAPIQIMGYLETTGLTFTHLWISGLDDQCWPQPVILNPFVPAATQRRMGLPRSSPRSETGFARERVAHWQSAAEHLIVSHARDSGESPLRPSPLIRQFPEVSRPELDGGHPHPGFVHRRGRLEVVDDEFGVPAPAGPHRGGTARIRDQALCPFRGYAIHRLELGEHRAPHGLPDPLDRGVLIHDALHRLYSVAQAEAKTAADLTPDDFTRAADASLRRHYARFPMPFRNRERERIAVLLEAWNRLEQAGISDGIEALEATVELKLDDIGLTLRADRIDRIGDALIVIDYKTGRIGNRLDRDRLIDPQLPLYALTDERIQGVLYAEIDELRPRLVGISELPVTPARVKPPVGGSWSEQRSIWRDQLEALIAEIRDGYAAVAPFAASACETCHLGALCRVKGPPS